MGDFNGDGKSDIIRAAGSSLEVSYGATGSWTVLSSIDRPVSRLVVGNFGHGGSGGDYDDVFTVEGTEWLVKWSGRGNWVSLGTGTYDRRYPVSFSNGNENKRFLVGQFDSDPYDDLFETGGYELPTSFQLSDDVGQL